MSKITVRDVSFAYKTTPILEQINMDIASGDFVCLLGQSGCGKSTFLRLMAGLEIPSGGEILVDGEPLLESGADRSMVFQDYSLFPWFTTGKNLLLALKQKYHRKSKKELVEKIRYYLNEVGLSQDVYDKYPNELSGGMRQRCAICRAFALDTSLMLMDEPFGALDAVNRARLQDMIHAMWAKKGQDRKTVLFVTHDVEEALLLSTRIFLFGTSPSKIIYSCELKDKHLINRNALFENHEMMELRNTLLHILNKDIEAKIKNEEQKL
ncbi:Bicarbonate transport ATP-binding protein CmpD [Sporomusa ovata DSM 2662]|uniref:Putative ABC transporter ATP-binding protein n=1 Tax=Sporomusa ovata TaxID=2378 RepID=A0A0U1KUZ8_9FIRM|nr:ABC transporter ATP-binding protein [Sporomusa ovata]EQB27087.1 ABC-type nitrate/sulfonate/bicarbonate transport system, ATPase component [Sporomusa ovata DSM 2662]CQR71191.1 putative ABC transporter ATP-binding protein [Sporomusa ovata]